MRSARLFAMLALLTTLALLGEVGSSGQDKEKKGDTPTKPAANGALPKYWDQLGLTDTQRTEVVRLSREQRDAGGQAPRGNSQAR
jgi:hypothetical protein